MLQDSEGDFHSLDEYNAFIYRVHGDGRKYIANLRTDNWITGGQSHDVWQAALVTECAVISQVNYVHHILHTMIGM